MFDIEGAMYDSPLRTTNPEGEIERSQRLRREAQNTIAALRGFWVDFLVRELELGIAFTRYAEDSRSQGREQACFSQKWIASQAYRTVQRFLSRANPTPEQRASIDLKLYELKARLKALDRCQAF